MDRPRLTSIFLLRAEKRGFPHLLRLAQQRPVAQQSSPSSSSSPPSSAGTPAEPDELADYVVVRDQGPYGINPEEDERGRFSKAPLRGSGEE